jgi:O-antigen/teichoic acid export membrane protein
VVLAMDSAASRWYWDTDDTADRKHTLATWAWCQLVVASVVAVAIIVPADQLAQLIVGNEDAGIYLRWSALTLPLSVMGAVTINWLRMQRRPWATTAYGLVLSLVSIPLNVLLVVVFRWGLLGIYVAQVITAVAGTAVALWLLRGWVSPWQFRWERLRAMLRYALPLIPAGLAVWVIGFADRYFIQFFKDTAEVGLYQVGSSVATLVALGTGAFQLAWGPFAISIHKQEGAPQVYASALLAYAWSTSVISTALALFAPDAIRLFATTEYLAASSVVGLLAFRYVMGGLVYIAALGPGLAKNTRPIGIAVSVAAVLNILLNVLLVPSLGMTGSALAGLISQTTVPIYLFYRSQQLYPIPYRFRPAAGILVLGLSVTALGLVLDFANQWVGIAVKLGLVALFVPALFLLRIVTPSQVRRLLAA